MNSKKRQEPLRILLEEILSVTIKQNYAEQLKAHQREIELLKGNLEESDKRFRALVKYLGVEFIKEIKYKKCSTKKKLKS